MPRFVSDLPQTYENIVRPVALSVARHLSHVFNMVKGIDVLMPGAAETTALTQSTVDDQHDRANAATFGANARLRLEITERPIEDHILTTAVHQKEHLPFFLDEKLGVVLYPVYSQTELLFHFTFRASSRTEARRFYNEALVKTAANRGPILHEIDYYYHVPYMYLHLLKHIHTLREQQAGYGDSYDKWISEHITNRARTITDGVGKNTALAIAEMQTHSMGTFQFAGVPNEPSKDKDNGTWNVEFEYRFVFDQAIQAVAEWPLLIHNQLVDEMWRSQPWASGDLIDPSRRLSLPSVSRHALDNFVRHGLPKTQCDKIIDGLVFPNFDEWVPRFVTPNTSTLFTSLLGLDPTSPMTLFSLAEDLDGYYFDPEVIEFMKKEAPFMNRKGESVFDVRLYEGDTPMADRSVIVTSDLMLLLAKEPDLRKTYHIRMSVVNDLFTLNDAAWERLREGGQAAIKVLNLLQWKLLGKSFEPRLLGGYLIHNDDLRGIAQRINDLKVQHFSGLEYIMLTVNSVLIVAHRSNEDVNDQKREQGPTADGTGLGEAAFTNPVQCDG